MPPAPSPGAAGVRTAPAPSGAASEYAPPPADEPKYEFESLIAEGAEGRVFVVVDRDLDRRLAMKVMRTDAAADERRVARFLAEARRTAALAHAAIPAVHDIGWVATGEMFFTMRLVEGRTLRNVFEQILRGEPEAVREWTLVRLVQVIQQVAAAADYAHCHGVIHRDLKPENIAVSDFQEVLVLDWGLSKRIGFDAEAAHVPSDVSPFSTQVGAVKGTPLYMAPEQARGAVDQLDQRADVFSLGAILYEALCRMPPYDGTTAEEIIENARSAHVVPISERERGRDVPRVLAEICMRALSAEPADRHANAKEFADDLQTFLDGTREREMRAGEASSLVESARRLAERARMQLDEGRRMDGMAADLRRTLPAWAEESEKVRVWQLEDGASRARIDAADTHARAADLASRALALDSTHSGARETLARLYLERLAEAEREGRVEDATWLRRTIERYDDGALAEEMRDRASLEIETFPPGADATLVRVAERNRRRVETDSLELERTPSGAQSVLSGDWIVRLRRDGTEPVRIPVRLRRHESRTLRVTLHALGTVPAGFVLVPGGVFLSGDERTEADVADFAILTRPVLLREYAAWLDELIRTDPAAAAQRLPWVESHGPLLRYDGARHQFAAAVSGAPRPLAAHANLPAVGVTREDAEAYAAWHGRRLGVLLRLPTELEWEKAARGTDGRIYPWGDRFDPSFCSMAESTREAATLRPSESFPADVSPYGVRDMAGGVREWCRDDVDAGRALAVCRGGAWYLRARECTVTSRWIVDAGTRNPGIGFRLVRPIG